VWPAPFVTVRPFGTTSANVDLSGAPRPARSPGSLGPRTGEILGFASGGTARPDEVEFAGEVYAIYLLEPSQRRGIGQRLFRALVQRLSQSRKRSLLVWVAAQNSSRAFYAALGGRPVRGRRIKFGGAEIDEVGYCWSNTGPLLTSDSSRR